MSSPERFTAQMYADVVHLLREIDFLHHKQEEDGNAESVWFYNLHRLEEALALPKGFLNTYSSDMAFYDDDGDELPVPYRALPDWQEPARQ